MRYIKRLGLAGVALAVAVAAIMGAATISGTNNGRVAAHGSGDDGHGHICARLQDPSIIAADPMGDPWLDEFEEFHGADALRAANAKRTDGQLWVERDFANDADKDCVPDPFDADDEPRDGTNAAYSPPKPEIEQLRERANGLIDAADEATVRAVIVLLGGDPDSTD